MFRKLLCVACLALLTLSAFAEGPPDLSAVDNTVIGVSDLIIIGTVSDVIVTPADAPYPGVKGSSNNIAAIEVDQVLKGSKLDKLSINYMSYGGSNKLETKQQKIFFLKRVQGGYAFANYFDVRNADQMDAITKRIKEFPLKVKSEDTVSPFFFGQETIVDVKLMNTGDKSIEIPQQGFFAETYFLSPLVKDSLPTTTQVVLPEGEKPNPANTYIVDAGGELTLQLKITCNTPQSWQLFTKDTYLQMPIALRLRVTSNHAKDADNKPIMGTMYSAATPWSTVMTGYALPDDINVEAGDKE